MLRYTAKKHKTLTRSINMDVKSVAQKTLNAFNTQSSAMLGFPILAVYLASFKLGVDGSI